MKIQFLGTSAAEGYPALFCKCKNCEKARKLGGKNLRSRSSVLIDDLLLLDIPPDILSKTQMLRMDLSMVEILAITHTHPDHFSYLELNYRRKPFALQDLTTLYVIANPTAIDIINNFYKDKIDEMKVKLVKAVPFEKYTIKGYTLYPIKAVHITNYENEIPLNYILQKNDKVILYACDTGPYTEDTLSFLKKFKFDLIIIESTLCASNREYHMSFKDLKNFSAWAKENNILKDNSRIIATHFSHVSCPSHEELEKILGQIGITPAYDFMIINV